MASSLTFDPAKGFVALPCEVMNIDMSPGAFRLLVELCRMANRTGECWPSLGQLSERIGRSKAAISGYIAELREIELIETTSQKMANGYNYRLKYCVTFWKSWRSNLARPKTDEPVQKEERSVQSAERRVNSKNHKHKNQLLSSRDVKDIFSSWKKHTNNTPFPHFQGVVDDNLVQDTRNLLTIERPKPLSKETLKTALAELWAERAVSISSEQLDEQITKLSKNKVTETGFDHLRTSIQTTWQKHWRKPPTLEQFDLFLSAAHSNNREEGMLKMLEQFLKRLEISRKKLQHSGASLSLALNRAA
jgi:hypothetical protein